MFGACYFDVPTMKAPQTRNKFNLSIPQATATPNCDPCILCRVRFSFLGGFGDGRRHQFPIVVGFPPAD